jgi:DNA-binding transcriptional MerR regulator
MYKLSQVASVAGIGAPTLGAWLDRKLINIPASGTGNHRSFSRDDIVRVALVAELTRLGIAVGEAAKAAATFCDDAHGDRDASELFKSGKTFLFVDADGARVVNIDASSEQFEAAMASVYAEARTAIVLNVNEVARRVDAALASGSSTAKAPAGAIFRHGRQMYV